MNANQDRSSLYPRRKTRFLTVVWGEAYIRRFATLSLPSFLAPGNLPALAAATDLEVVIMTRREDIDYFHTHRAFQRLRAICPVRFVEIDDLVTTGMYGVTLTLAYARPIIACGAEMLNTHFVFMNADFVLADGSLRSLARHIAAGRSVVLGPSFRATAEQVEPHLETAVDTGSGVLAIAPRVLTALSLPHPHPTTAAKIVNQTFCHSRHPNQFFWQVDASTLLGRYYLIFMLCLKPERIIQSVNCFCDYAFIPEMCPSGDEVAMGDSDEFFMLELQSQKQEMHLLRLGAAKDSNIARSLGEWTTVEHRRAARHDIVFHTADVPPQIEDAKKHADAFVARIAAKLRRPIPHGRHRYWLRAVEAWRQHRESDELSSSPAELAPPPTDWLSVGKRWLWSIAYAGRLKIIGDWPRVTPLHPSWIDFLHLRDAIARICRPGTRLLVVREHGHAVDPLIPRRLSVRFITPEALLRAKTSATRPAETERFTHVLMYLHRKDCHKTELLVEQCETMIGPGGGCTVFMHDDAYTGRFEEELLDHVEGVLGWPLRPALCSFVGGRLKRAGQQVLLRVDLSFTRWGLWALPLTLPFLLAWLPLTLLENLCLRLVLPSRNFVRNCTSVLIQIAPATQAIAGGHPISTRELNSDIPGHRISHARL